MESSLTGSAMLTRLMVLYCYLHLLSASGPADTNWRVNLYMTPPGNQLNCETSGFAVGGLLEWYAANVTGKLIPLSTQFYVDCFSYNGCNDGGVTDGLEYAMKYQYHPYAQDYGFTGDYDPQTCVDKGVKDRTARNALADVWVYDYTRLTRTAAAIQSALSRGPVMVSAYVSDNMPGVSGDEVFTDSKCVSDPKPHSMLFVGYQNNGDNPYYIVKNSWGDIWADGGYINYAANAATLQCITKAAYSVRMGRRREVEYRWGKGKSTYKKARAKCQSRGGGWDLAIIPTRMHNLEVEDMITAKEHDGKKSIPFIWIGINKGKEENTLWVDEKTTVVYENWGDDYNYKHNFAAMNKGGKWLGKPETELYSYMCSRFRAEECPRISQTAVENASKLTMLKPGAGETLEIEAGTHAVVTCMEGYVRVGPGTSVCRKDGTWGELPSCAAGSKETKPKPKKRKKNKKRKKRPSQ